MAPITAALLARLPGVRANPLLEPLAAEFAAQLAPAGIDTALRQAHFLGQAGIETWRFARLVEDLDYQAATIAAVFPHLKPRAPALAHNSEALGSAAYASKDGNGDEASGDGFRYRGRGGLDLTGKANYAAAGQALGLDLVSNPDLAAEPANAVKTAIWFWHQHRLNVFADADDGIEITRRVTGGRIDLVERLSMKTAALKALM